MNAPGEGLAGELFTLDELTGPAMTPAEARERYGYGTGLSCDPGEWHSQPVCECGAYLATHDIRPPHVSFLASPAGLCRCTGYRYARMGRGGPTGTGDRDA